MFNYKNVDTEVLALVLTKVTGKDLATLISERIWAPMGAADNAYVIKGSGRIGRWAAPAWARLHVIWPGLARQFGWTVATMAIRYFNPVHLH